MNRFRCSWRILMAALKFLSKNRDLLVLPLIPGFVMVVLAATVLGGGILHIFHASPDSGTAGAIAGTIFASHLFPAVIGLFYLIGFFISIFFNSALVGCVLLRLEGRSCTWRDGISLAFARRKAIFQWSLLNATIGVVLCILDQSLSSVTGKVAARLAGVGWSLAAFMVLPVIMFEDQSNALTHLRRSGELFRRTWGEQISGRVGLDAALAAVAGLAVLVVSVLIVALVFVLAKGLGVGAERGLPPVVGTASAMLLIVLVGYPMLRVALNAFTGLSFTATPLPGFFPMNSTGTCCRRPRGPDECLLQRRWTAKASCRRSGR